MKHSQETKDIIRKKATIHGLRYAPEYSNWVHMRARCNDKNNKYYGSKGIKVCDRWNNSIKNFIDDMGPKPSSEYSIDRKDSNGDYTKDNCKWSNKKEQSIFKIGKKRSKDTKIKISETLKRYYKKKTTC